MKSRRQQPQSKRKRRWRLVCEPLEPRLMMAADTVPESIDLLDALDSLTLTTIEDETAAEFASDDSFDGDDFQASDDSLTSDEIRDEDLGSDPGSLAGYLSDLQVSIDAAGDAASV